MMALTTHLIFVVLVKYVSCEQYLVALTVSKDIVYIAASVGQGEGSLHVRFPNGTNETFQLGSYSRRLVTVPRSLQAPVGVSNNTITVNTSSDAVTVNIYFRYAAFTPLPVSALGTRYIMPFCDAIRSTSFLLIASYNMETNIKITFRLGDKVFKYGGQTYGDGDFFTQTLNPYQTLYIPFTPDFTGTVVDTSSPAAVYMGSVYSSINIGTLDQLLPVNAYGKEYVVAVDDHAYKYKLQILSDSTDAVVNFTDGSSDTRRFFRMDLAKNATLGFNSTKPVMATLCRKAKNYYDSVFGVVLPANSFMRREASIYIPFAKTTSIVKITTEKSSSVKISQFATQQIPTDWSMVSGTDYKTGTCKVSNTVATSIRSDNNFTILVYSPYYLHNGGYYYKVDDGRAKPDSPDSPGSMSCPPSGQCNGLYNGQCNVSRVDSDNQGGSTATVVGVVCGVIIAVLVVIIAILVFYIKRKATNPDTAYEKPIIPAVPASPVPVSIVNPAADYRQGSGNAQNDEAPYMELETTTEHDYAKF